MISRASVLGALLAALCAPLAALVACGEPNVVDTYSCKNPDKKHIGPSGRYDPCHYEDVDGGADADAHAEPRCIEGEFAHWRAPWERPTLLWFGPPEQAPECPRGPATISYEGHGDLVAPALCEACTCEPPTGSCALPSKLTASTAVCGTQGAMTSFDAPASWNGSCDSTTQAPAGAAHSLTIDPIKMTETGCASGPPIAAKIVPLHWETFARGCDVGLPEGPTERSACLPPEPIEPGFKACIYLDGENDCPYDDPGNVFTEQHVFYQDVEEARKCSACSCGAPTGSACTAMLSIYKGGDVTCSGPVAEQKAISSEGPVCLDLAIPGQALGSKSAGPTTYLPGTCPSMGGEASGSAVKIHPTTLCCRP